MSITKSSFHQRRTKGTLRKNDGNCKNKAYHKCMYMFKAFNAVAVAAANTGEFKMPLRRRQQDAKTQFGKISETTAEVVSAFGQHRKFPPHARKASGTQGKDIVTELG